MEFKKIDINTVVVDGITYTAVEHDSCDGCELEGQCHNVLCGGMSRSDERYVIWKRKTTDIQNKPSSEHTKPIDIKVVSENKIIVDGIKYQPIAVSYGCEGCAFIDTICHRYAHQIPCTISKRKDSKSVIWKKVPDKQIHVSLQEIRQTKKKIYKLNFKP